MDRVKEITGLIDMPRVAFVELFVSAVRAASARDENLSGQEICSKRRLASCDVTLAPNTAIGSVEMDSRQQADSRTQPQIGNSLVRDAQFRHQRAAACIESQCPENPLEIVQFMTQIKDHARRCVCRTVVGPAVIRPRIREVVRAR